ncbi:MAG TPA: tRNA pseudouridine(38-40) synthase TruA [Acidimicrobiia bacterium]|nr:tRNA pseudouridine(38-40) synthase TruA [Acidimicrobiia bacterium]
MTLFDAGSPASSPPTDRGRLKLVVAYDGTDFHGFAVQREVRTVGGFLTDALVAATGQPADALHLVCAGRTDAGVHAHGQVVTVDVPEGDDEALRRAVNGMAAPEVVVRDVERVPAGFDARHSARWRRYRYTILNRPEPDPFLARYAWWVPQPLDLTLLRLAADPFVGEHDFAAFCRRAGSATTVRRVLDSCWHAEGDVLRYEIRAKAFCWQMVRAIVGTLVDVGTGRRRPGDMLAVLRSGDRAQAPRLAPAHGLCLWDVGYDALSSPR